MVLSQSAAYGILSDRYTLLKILLLKYLLTLLLLFLSFSVIAAPKPGTTMTFEWWEGGTFTMRFTLSEQRAKELEDPLSAARLMIIDSSGGNYQLEYKPAFCDEGRSFFFSVTVKKKGYFHILMKEPLEADFGVTGTPPDGVLKFSKLHKNVGGVETKCVRFLKDSPHAVQPFSQEYWKVLAASKLGVNLGVLFAGHNNLIKGIYTGLEAITYHVSKGALVRVRQLTVYNALKLAEQALVPKKKFLAEISEDHHAGEISQQLESLELSNSDTPKMEEEPGQNQFNVSTPRTVLASLKPDDPLAQSVFPVTMSHMGSFGGSVPDMFLHELDILLPESAPQGFSRKNVPLLYFLHAARIAGCTTYESLPSFYGIDGVNKALIDKYFDNPEYDWGSLAEAQLFESLENSEGDDHKRGFGCCLDGDVEKLISALRSSSGDEEDAILEKVINKMLGNGKGKYVILDKIKAGDSLLAKRIILERNGEQLIAEVRLFQFDNDDVFDNYNHATCVANHIDRSDKGKKIEVLPQLIGSYSCINHRTLVLISIPSYACMFDDIQVQTIRELIQSREVKLGETLDILRNILKVLAQLHSEDLLFNFIRPERVALYYSERKELTGLTFVEVMQGLRLLDDGTPDPDVLIRQNIFQVVKLFYFMRAKEPLEDILQTLTCLDSRFSDEESLSTQFFNDPEGSWKIWMQASSTPNLQPETDELRAVRVLGARNMDHKTASKIQSSIELIIEMPGNPSRPQASLAPEPSAEAVPAGRVLKISPDQLFAPQKKVRFRAECKKGHVLTMRHVSEAYDQYDSGVVCDMCKENTGQTRSLCGGDILSCRDCQYDQCGPCSAHAMEVHALPPHCKCDKNHTMKLITSAHGIKPEGRTCDNDRCGVNLDDQYHYRCGECYFRERTQAGGKLGYDYCPECAFWRASDSVFLKNLRKSGDFYFTLVPGFRNVTCQRCRARCVGGSGIFTDCDESVCTPCAVEQLKWFGSKTAHIFDPGKSH